MDKSNRDGYKFHSIRECPMKKRLRKLILNRFHEKAGGDLAFINRIYSENRHFYEFVASFYDKVNKTK